MTSKSTAKIIVDLLIMKIVILIALEKMQTNCESHPDFKVAFEAI
jgi:hypothetical protein